jgi:protein-arginine kinase activator protein McsA
MFLFRFLKRIFTKYDPTRVYVKDVKPGETIVIEWFKIKNGIGNVTCVNNDLKTKKILIEVKWGNAQKLEIDEIEHKIFSYYSKELKNFNLLNGIKRKPVVDKVDTIESLQKELNDAISSEDYEKASKLRKKIDKLKKFNK